MLTYGDSWTIIRVMDTQNFRQIDLAGSLWDATGHIASIIVALGTLALVALVVVISIENISKTTDAHYAKVECRVAKAAVEESLNQGKSISEYIAFVERWKTPTNPAIKFNKSKELAKHRALLTQEVEKWLALTLIEVRKCLNVK